MYMEIILRLIEMLENILKALIEKLNIVTIMLILVLLGVMNQETVFSWFTAIGKAFSTTFSF